MAIRLPKNRLGILCSGACIAAVLCAAFYALPRPALGRTPAFVSVHKQEAVSIANAAGAARLSGSLMLPDGPGPFPAIVLIAGSGDVDRDGELFGHKFYLVLADHLTKQGFAVLRSDKRGLGKSSGNYAAATTADFASDVKAAVAHLRARPDIDPKRIGLVGHSEGGFIAPMVASDDPAIAFVVMMAGNGVNGAQMLLDRIRRVKMAGKPVGDVERELALQREVFAAITSAKTLPERTAMVRQIFLQANKEYGRAFSENELPALMTPWMRAFLVADPAPFLRKVRCPVLALLGEKDQIVIAADNAPALEQALGANPGASVRRLAGLNHFFQNAPTGSFSEIAQIKETMAPAALDLIGAWSSKQAGLAP